jgi:hypothetical protein
LVFAFQIGALMMIEVRTMVLLLALALASAPVQAADDPRNGDIGDIKLGLQASQLSTDKYMDFACGTNGGPPGVPLANWTDFAKCKEEADSGLHEVYFRFDDELEYIARAHRNADAIDRYGGTKLADQPVVVSVLFDDAGMVKGMRIVTDDRAEIADRKTANLFGLRIMNRYDPEAWTCIDKPPSGGRTPIGGVYVDRKCTETFNGDRQLTIQFSQYRRRGQTGVGTNGEYLPDAFENQVRVDILTLPRP